MIPTTIDFETYYDTEYSLRRMTPEEYIRDPRFEIQGCAVQPHGRRGKYITGDSQEEIIAKLRRIDWSQVYCIAHNNLGFDSLILTEKVGVRPRRYGCTLAMARQLHGGRGNSLEDLAKRYGIAGKVEGALESVKGVRLADYSPNQRQFMAQYAIQDASICTQLFYFMLKGIPPKDMQQIHWFTKMFAEPRLTLDGGSYRTWLAQMLVAKDALLEEIGVDIKALRSNPQFAELLRAEGIEPPLKLSKTTGKETFAFAKTDKGMTALLDDPNERVQALVEARLKTKSSIEQTRVERFVGIASRGRLPVPLTYGKTHTNRAAGAGKINLQNLGKGKQPDERTLPKTLVVTPKGLRTFDRYDPERKAVHTREGQEFPVGDCHSFNLRDGIGAPPGHKIVVVDSSNIELRVAHALAGQMDTVAKLLAGVDLYSDFASELYGYPVIKGQHKKERQHGKVGMLQLQYQSGAGAFKEAARIMGGIILTDEEAETTVQFYRTRFALIPKFWKRCQNAIKAMSQGKLTEVDDLGLVTTGKDCLYLPRGRVLTYKNLREIPDEKFGTAWTYEDKSTGKPKYLYGGAVFENICQAIAGTIVMDQCVEIEKVYGRYDSPTEGVALTVHDEGVIVVLESKAQDCLSFAIKTMSTSPEWWPDIPLAAEGDIADRYGSAK